MTARGAALRSPAEHAAERRAAEQRREAELYGDTITDVQYLRTRGFSVISTGEALVVDGKSMTRAEAKALAARERSVAGDRSPGVRRVVSTASGLRVGQQVNLPRPERPSPPPRPAPPPKPTPAQQPQRALSGAAAAAAAKAAEHSSDLGARPRVVWLGLELLVVDGTYQRDVSQAGRAHISSLRRAWNWNCYQPVIVSERADGKYAVIDGQHRLLAAKGHPLISELPCYIVEAPEASAQAAIFATVNSRRLSLTSLQVFWASHAAGDPMAGVCVRICAAAGVSILRTMPSGDIPPLSIRAPVVLQRAVKRVGERATGEALKLLAETHPTAINAFRAPTVAALCRIAAETSYSGKRWRAVLSAIDLDRFYVDMFAERSRGGGTLDTAAERVLRQHAAKVS